MKNIAMKCVWYDRWLDDEQKFVTRALAQWHQYTSRMELLFNDLYLIAVGGSWIHRCHSSMMDHCGLGKWWWKSFFVLPFYLDFLSLVWFVININRPKRSFIETGGFESCVFVCTWLWRTYRLLSMASPHVSFDVSIPMKVSLLEERKPMAFIRIVWPIRSGRHLYDLAAVAIAASCHFAAIKCRIDFHQLKNYRLNLCGGRMSSWSSDES